MNLYISNKSIIFNSIFSSVPCPTAPPRDKAVVDVITIVDNVERETSRR